MKYAHIISTVISTPWAILDAKFDSIVSVLARCEAGERYSEEQIREVCGPKKNISAAMPYVLDEDGDMFPTILHPETGNIEASCFVAAAGAAGISAKGKLTAVIPVYGILMPRAADFDMSEFGTSIESLRKQFRAAIDNPDVKTVLFDFDSPGGSVYQIDELAVEIFQARNQKKIIAQVNAQAASAAYYLAAQASEIVITPSGEAGSIGVRAMHQDISKALEMKGIKITNISAGKYKTEGNRFEPLSEEGLAFMQQRVNEYYDMFLKAVARGREMKLSEVAKDFGQGRVFGAVEAKNRGMVDRIATLDETLARIGAAPASARVPAAAETLNAVLAEGGKPSAEELPSGGGVISIAACGDSAVFFEQHPDFLRSVVNALREQSLSRSLRADDPSFVAGNIRGEGVNPASAENNTEAHMSTTATPAAAAATPETIRASAVAEADRVAKINQLAGLHSLTAKASKWISDGATVESVQAEILNTFNPRAIHTAAGEDRAFVVMEQFDKRDKSLVAGSLLRLAAASKKTGRPMTAVAKKHVEGRRPGAVRGVPGGGRSAVGERIRLRWLRPRRHGVAVGD
jgi:signal peptide peptidase SppA